MARNFPGTSTTDYLQTAGSAVFNVATNVCWWAVLKLDTAVGIVGHAGTVARGTALTVQGTGDLGFSKEGSGGVAGTALTQLSTGIWYAVQAQSTTGGPGKFKRYQYATDTLAVETVPNATVIFPASGDPLTLGNHGTPTTGLAVDGVIDRVALLQADPSDAEFVAWARTGRLPAGLTCLCYAILWEASPTGDLSGNGHILTVTGTTPVPGAPLSRFTAWASASSVDPDVAAPQLARPMIDTTRDNWEDASGGTTSLYAQLEEAQADDTTYIRTGTTPTNDVYVSQLSPMTDPVASTGHVLRYRIGRDAGTVPVDLTVQVREGYTDEGSPGTLIAERVHTNVAPGWTLVTLQLSAAEADSITDYTDLSVRLVGNAP